MDREPSPFSIERTSLSESVAQRVLDLIKCEGIESGGRLPPVKVLAQRFAIATPTMREALQRLAAVGMIEIRHGSGIYIRNATEQVMLPNPFYGPLELQTIFDLLDTRLLIEPELTEMATRRVDEAGIAALEWLLADAEQHLEGDYRSDQRLHAANLQFHCKIAALSGNSVLKQVIASLMGLHRKEQMVVLYLYADRTQDFREHKDIFAAIRDRKPVKARRLMRDHIEDVKTTIQLRVKDL